MTLGIWVSAGPDRCVGGRRGTRRRRHAARHDAGAGRDAEAGHAGSGSSAPAPTPGTGEVAVIARPIGSARREDGELQCSLTPHAEVAELADAPA